MNNRVLTGLVVGSALLVGFAVGRFTADTGVIARDGGDKAAGKKTAVATKRSAYRPPHMETAANAPAAEAPAEDANTNRSGRGRGGFGGFMGGGTNFAAMMKERAGSERSNLFANVSLTPAQQQDFDDIVSAMNSSLKQRADALVAAAKEGKIAGPEVMVHMMHDSSTSMLRAYDMMDRTMPAGWREKTGNNFNLMMFMDPSIRDSMRALRPPRGGGPGGGGPGGTPPQ